MLEYDEKRNYIRMDAHCRMTYKFPQSDEINDATCVNLSGAGLLFNASEALEPGIALEIRVIPENNITPPMKAFVEIVRCTPNQNDQYEIAAAIKGIKAD